MLALCDFLVLSEVVALLKSFGCLSVVWLLLSFAHPLKRRLQMTYPRCRTPWMHWLGWNKIRAIVSSAKTCLWITIMPLCPLHVLSPLKGPSCPMARPDAYRQPTYLLSPLEAPSCPMARPRDRHAGRAPTCRTLLRIASVTFEKSWYSLVKSWCILDHFLESCVS